MTFTTYTAKLKDANGFEYYAHVYWDKHTPNKLTGSIHRIVNGIADFSTYSVTWANTPRNELEFVARIKWWGSELGAQFLHGEFTQFSAHAVWQLAHDLATHLAEGRRERETDHKLAMLDGGIALELIERAEELLKINLAHS